MTLPEADTTPLAMAAKLLHEVQRTVDLITVGIAKDPWTDLGDAKKELQIRQADLIWGKSFPNFYESFCQPYVLVGRTPPATVDEEDHEFVQYARMLHSIVHGVLGSRRDADSASAGEI